MSSPESGTAESAAPAETSHAPLSRLARGQRGVLRHWPLLAVAVVVLVSVLVDFWWLHRFRDGFPLDIDESRYVAFGFALKDGLAADGVAGFWHTWSAQHEFGPLLPLTSLPVYLVLGASLMNAMATQLGFFAVLIFASYGIGTRLTSRAGGALVALVVATTPAVIDFTRTYQFPVTAAAMLAASTYALLASEGLSRRRWSVVWGVLLGLTALARTMTVAFIPGQLLAAGWLVLGRPEARRQRGMNLATGAAAALLTASVWFASSWRAVANYLTTLGFGASSAHFGTSRSRLSPGYWTLEVADTVRADLYLPLAFFLAVAILLGFAALVVRSRTRPIGGTWRRSVRCWALSDAAVVLLVVVEAYLALTASRNEGVGFRLVVIPGLVALAVAAIWKLPWRRVRASVIAGLIGVSALNAAMKTDATSAVSKTLTVDVPGLGETPVLLGQGYIHRYVLGAFEATPPSVTQPLPTSQKRWLPAYDRLVVQIHTLGRRHKFTPVVALATDEPLLNPNNLTLAARLHFHENLAVVLLASPAGVVSVASYRGLLSQRPVPNVLVTVSRLALSYVTLTGGVSIDQQLISRVARSLGFVRLAAVQLPDARSAVVSWRRQSTLQNR